jgi:hypothetical protein
MLKPAPHPAPRHKKPEPAVEPVVEPVAAPARPSEAVRLLEELRMVLTGLPDAQQAQAHRIISHLLPLL